MILYEKFVVLALAASLGLLLSQTGANGACATVAGVWYFYDMQGSSPNIKTKLQNVVVSTPPTRTRSIKAFDDSTTSPAYENDTARIIKCRLNVSANGSFTAPCTSYGVHGSPHAVNISGRLALSAACDLTGTITVPGDPRVVIQGGHVNGNMGSGIATQGAFVHHFTIVKK